MKGISLESYGKINLGLDILYKRPDNYHQLRTIMQGIDLKDIIVLEEIPEGIIIESDSRELPLNSENLAYRACDLIKKEMNINKGIHIKIYKRIPIAAGLAGGSTNAASVLRGLNQLWDLKLSDEKLRDLGKELGADVPYCIMGGTALAEGIGEKLRPLKSFAGKDILLVNPGIGISTEDVYGKLDLSGQESMDMDKMVQAIENDDLAYLANNMKNTMEKIVIDENPIIGRIKQDMMENGALGALMSGSGPTVFAIFEDEESLCLCQEILKEKYQDALVIKAKTI